MKRSDLEHVLRAAGAITGVKTWVIVGSQAILGAVPDAPDELLVSQEVDLYAPGDAAASDLVDGSIGDALGVTVLWSGGLQPAGGIPRARRAEARRSTGNRPLLPSTSRRHL